MTEYTFFTNPMSRGQIARWALHEAEADYETELVDWQAKPDALITANPMGKVPVLIHHHGDHIHTISECAAICAYLADAERGGELAPQDHERAAYYRAMFFAAGPVEQALMARAMGWEVPADKQGTVGFGSYDRTIDMLAMLVSEGDYVCGERFTMADVYVGSQIDWGLNFTGLPERNEFVTYAERLRERDAYREAKAIDMDLITKAQN